MLVQVLERRVEIIGSSEAQPECVVGVAFRELGSAGWLQPGEDGAGC